MTTGPRGRLIASTIATVQEHGVHAAGLSELLKRSNASRNSLYQHFPAGKGELVETAARIVSRVVYSHVSVAAEALAQAPSVSRWLDELFAFWRDPLESSEYREGSFMMAAALDELDPAVQAAAGQAFTEWTDRLAAGLVAAGAAPHAADALAGVLLSVIEGAILQSRALKSAHPFDDARTQLTLLLEHQLPPRPTNPHRDGITTAPDNPTPTAHGDDTPAHDTTHPAHDNHTAIPGTTPTAHDNTAAVRGTTHTARDNDAAVDDTTHTARDNTAVAHDTTPTAHNDTAVAHNTTPTARGGDAVVVD
ncbi:TetR/AcrR family transcriptional regulator [Nocardia wallacei]|uniref:TetR/AcrR family transcriptional regulator n=1 Tax=Nocardia wallacei TaxID=480035 RepID=UPI002453E996|nr:TetR/AcrR family transcriptional regulator [Nocardia wallacei]